MQRKDLSEADVSFLNLLSNAMAMHMDVSTTANTSVARGGSHHGSRHFARAQRRLRVLRVAVLREQEAGAHGRDDRRGSGYPVHEFRSSEASRHFKAEVQLLLLELEGRENIRQFRDAIKRLTRDMRREAVC